MEKKNFGKTLCPEDYAACDVPIWVTIISPQVLPQAVPHMLRREDKDYPFTLGEAEALIREQDCSRPHGQLWSVSQDPRGLRKAFGKHSAIPQEPAGQQDWESGDQSENPASAVWP